MALIDLWFAEEKDKKIFNCELCRKNPATAIKRNCQSPGFENLKKPMKVDTAGIAFNFCPGKSTWYEEIQELFEQCRIALETGILPSNGTLEDQTYEFASAFPHFVQRWKERNYLKIWVDVQEYVEAVLKSIFGKPKK